MNIKDILDKHAAWLRGEPEGVKADLTGANLTGADLSEANLFGANLSKANLSGAQNVEAAPYGTHPPGANLA